MIGGDAGGDRATFELRINGLLGPLLLGALPHAAVSVEPRHALVITDGDAGTDLLDVLRVLLATGVEVDSVRAIGPSEPDETHPI